MNNPDIQNSVLQQYACPDCGYIYDESNGAEHEGYPAGTKWVDIPEDFPCPDCFITEKPDFLPFKT